jgi:DoxX-like family
MLLPLGFLLALILAGACAAALLARRLERVDGGRLARGYLAGVAVLMGVRAAAYVANYVFGIRAVLPLGTGPFDPTNLLIGGLYGIAVVHASRGTFDVFLRQPEVLFALRLATGVAFVLAGMANYFLADAGRPDYFLQMGYTKTFHHFIVTAEVLGGVALLLPWRWLVLTAAFGLTIDMFGALYTLLRFDQIDAYAIAMLFRLAPLAALSLDRRWAALGVGGVACMIIAIVGSTLLHRSS